MIEYYVNQIHMGVLTIDQIPEIWHEKVRQALQGNDVEPPIIDTDIPKKSAAYDYLTGRSPDNE